MNEVEVFVRELKTGSLAFLGLFSNLLRKHRLRRLKGRAIFIRHSIGLGGIYAEICDGGCRLTVTDLGTVELFTSASAMSKRLEEISDIDSVNIALWNNRVNGSENTE